MGGHLKATLITIPTQIQQFVDKKWTADQLKKWVSGAGGKLSAKFIEGETTHVVCSEKSWKEQGPVIQAALAYNEKMTECEKRSPAGNGTAKIVKILSPDWLEEALTNSCKPNPGSYSWEKMDRKAMLIDRQAEKAAARVEKEFSGPRTTQGLMAEVLQEVTEKYISLEDKAQLERDIQIKKQAVIEAAKEEAAQKLREREQAALFRKGAKKARNEIFSGRLST